MQHKKRGRPKLREKKIYSSNEHTYEILYGTIQTPSITMKNPTRNIIPNIQVPPFKTKITNTSKPHSIISFIHEPIESFQSNNNQQHVTDATTSVPLTYDNVLLESMLPQLSSTPQPQKEHQLLFDYNNANIFYSNALLNSTKPDNQLLEGEADDYLTIIMSMEVCCAKVSDDTIKCWGYYPQELAHRSFYDFISPKDSDRLARLHRLLLDNVRDTVTGDNSSLPPTERTTSSLFSTTDHSILNTIANGSRSFSDSIHIKKRSGEYELYKVVVYIGGGLGANLYDITSYSKQYIVAQFRKHEYEVAAQSTPGITATLPSDEIYKSSAESSFYNIEPIAVFSPMSPMSPLSPSNNLLAFNKNDSYAKVDMFKENSLFNQHKSLSTTRKFSQMSIIPPCSSPKFNIAPVTTVPTPTPSTLSFQHNKHFSNSLLNRFPSSVATPPASMRLRSTDNGMVTHPTQQYFLQTSSSSLNAVASAVNNKSRLSKSGPARSENPSTSNQKMEMSIRSLLC